MKPIAILKAWLGITPAPPNSDPFNAVHAVLLDYMGAVKAMYLRVDGQYHRITEWRNASPDQIWVALEGSVARRVRKTTSVWCVPKKGGHLRL